MFFIVLLLYFPDGSSSQLDHVAHRQFSTRAACMTAALDAAAQIAPLVRHGFVMCQSRGETAAEMRRDGEVSFNGYAR